MGMIINPFASGVSGPAIQATTWSTTNKHASLTLTNGNLTVDYDNTGVNEYRSIRASSSRAASDSNGFMFGVRVDAAPASAFQLVGLVTSAVGITTTGVWVGESASSWGIYQSDNTIYSGGAAVGTADSSPAWSDVANYVFAFVRGGKIWFGVNDGGGFEWLGGGSPNANTSPAVSGMSGTVFPAASLWRDEHLITGLFTAADLVAAGATIPTGGYSWTAN